MRAVLCCAVLCCAVLCCAVLCCAVLCCAVLRCCVHVRGTAEDCNLGWPGHVFLDAYSLPPPTTLPHAIERCASCKVCLRVSPCFFSNVACVCLCIVYVCACVGVWVLCRRGEAGPAWSDVPNGSGMQWGGANWGERVAWVHKHLLDSATKANVQVLHPLLHTHL